MDIWQFEHDHVHELLDWMKKDCLSYEGDGDAQQGESHTVKLKNKIDV